MNCLTYPSILLQMDYIDHMHHMQCSAFSDSVWRQMVAGHFSIQMMSGSCPDWFSQPGKARHNLKCLFMKRDSLSSAILCSLPMAAGKCNDNSMATWPFYPSPEADNCARNPELRPLMYLDMKPTERRSTDLEESRWTWLWSSVTFSISEEDLMHHDSWYGNSW